MLKQMQEHDVKCWWSLRNDDIFNFRWGDPEYVRGLLSNLPEKTAGYHMGSDRYVWGREFTSLEPEEPQELETDKHWKNYAAVASKLYKPQLLARTRVLDWNRILDDVKKDVEIARKSGRK